MKPIEIIHAVYPQLLWITDARGQQRLNFERYQDDWERWKELHGYDDGRYPDYWVLTSCVR